MNYCDNCGIRHCELRGNINFCEDCKEYLHCKILSPCAAGYDVECNNGFEPCDVWDDEEEDEE